MKISNLNKITAGKIPLWRTAFLDVEGVEVERHHVTFHHHDLHPLVVVVRVTREGEVGGGHRPVKAGKFRLEAEGVLWRNKQEQKNW